MKSSLKLKAAVFAAAMCFSAGALATNYALLLDNRTDEPATSMLTGEQIDANASVVRHLDHAYFEFNARHMVPGNAYTLWVMHYDRPERCFDRCNCTFDDFVNENVTAGAMGAMSGRVADEYGQLSMGNVIKYGAQPPSPGNILIPGVIKNERAHFQLVLRDHGPASNDPAVLEAQLTSWAGGCNVNSCQDIVISDHPSPYCRSW